MVWLKQIFSSSGSEEATEKVCMEERDCKSSSLKNPTSRDRRQTRPMAARCRVDARFNVYHVASSQPKRNKVLVCIGILAVIIVAFFTLFHLVIESCDDCGQPCTDDCRLEMVESIPDNLTFSPSSVSHRSTYDAWSTLIDSAVERLDIVAFYWTLRGVDFYQDPSDWKGESIYKKLLSAITERHIKVRIVQSSPSEKISLDNDSFELAAAGAELRSIDFVALFKSGVLHTKMLLVDGTSLYVGSANMDWRSLTQVKELGAYVTHCPCLVSDASKIFDVYWYMGQPDTPVPSKWPSSYSTQFNMNMPMKVKLNGTDSLVYFSSSPPPFCPSGRTGDIDALVDVISKADRFVHIAVMDYEPAIIFSHPVRFWPVIDDALRKASVERGVTVRLLASKWNSTKPEMIHFLRSLADLNGALNANIQVKLFVVPAFTPEQAKIPFGRVNHNKYMVTDKTAFIGTSNWSGDYFTTTAGVSLVVSQNTGSQSDDAGSQLDDTDTVQQQLAAIFDRDWNSTYAHNIDDIVDT